jgi:hypothetical protein
MTDDVFDEENLFVREQWRLSDENTLMNYLLTLHSNVAYDHNTNKK